MASTCYRSFLNSVQVPAKSEQWPLVIEREPDDILLLSRGSARRILENCCRDQTSTSGFSHPRQ
jgi:hypothetical protein